MADEIRIHKLLASWGLCSRRQAEKWVAEGRIVLNDSTVATLGTKVEPNNVRISIDGKSVSLPAGFALKTLAFNKPFGVLCSLSDPFSDDLLSAYLPAGTRLFPIGRLDKNSTGLLLVTNDGALANRLLHPRFKVSKEYHAVITGMPLSRSEIQAFSQGIEIDGKVTQPCTIRKLGEALYEVVLSEGRKRQIRCMFACFGRQVASLERVRFGPIRLGDLPSGRIRELTVSEEQELYSAAGLPVPVQNRS